MLLSMIKVENLTKSFNNTKAVDNLCFEITNAGIIGLLGPNGAGKTTTMRLIVGTLAPEQGIVYKKGNIGYLPENNPLYKDMLVSDAISMSMDLKHIPKQNRKKELDFIVSSTGINNVFYRPISELSKGYRQRVGIAMALLNNPRILIMDEPTEGLDPNQRNEMRKLIKYLAKDRIIIISTHILQEASLLCDRLLIINKGKLVADASPNELSGKIKNQKTFLIEIQGNNIEYLLNKIQGITKIDIQQKENNKLSAKIICEQSFQPQPIISRLCNENNWIIWKISEQKQNLEKIFQELTISNEKI